MNEIKKSVEDEQTEIDDNLGDEDKIVPFKYTITSYGADYTIDGLVNRIQRGDIVIPFFQRRFVWDIRESSRFIETILLGLPVPGIFLSKEEKTEKLLVIDGQQRLKSLQYFYEGVFGPTQAEFSLQGVQDQLDGLKYNTLPDDFRRKLDDSILHATIVKQDKPTKENTSIIHIFERLNTGGRFLYPHEIRACIYHGKFNDLLKELNQVISWRNIFGKENRRLRDQELILRFLAFYYNFKKYSEPMKGFLNSFMAEYRNLDNKKANEFSNTFTKNIDIAFEQFGWYAFKPRRQINAAVFDSIMVGLGLRVKKGPIKTNSLIKNTYEDLLKNEEYISSIDQGTASEENVKKRIGIAVGAFAKIK